MQQPRSEPKVYDVTEKFSRACKGRFEDFVFVLFGLFTMALVRHQSRFSSPQSFVYGLRRDM
jgi:hypothetical protein